MESPQNPTGVHLATSPLVCVECCRPWVTGSERWRLMLTDDEETVPYCPDCATREFGPA